MLNKVIILFFAFFAFGHDSLVAQDWNIYYNLFTDSIEYRKDGKLIKTPKFRKGDFVVVHFTEFNPYLYTGDVNVEQSNTDESDGSSGIGIMGQTPGLLSGMIPGMGILGGRDSSMGLNFMDLPLLRVGESSIKLKDLFSNSRGADQLLEQAQQKTAALVQLQSEMALIYKEIKQLDRSEKVAEIANVHVAQLLVNPRIRPSLIQKICSEYQSLIFPEKNAAALAINDAFEWQNHLAEKNRLLLELDDKMGEFEDQLLELNPVVEQMGNLDLNNEALDQFVIDLGDLSQKGTRFKQQVNTFVQSGMNADKKGLSVSDILNLQMNFREIAAQAFSYSVPISLGKHQTEITAHFAPLDSLLATAQGKKLGAKIKTLKIQTQGGMRISPGVGFHFGRFFTPAEEFSVRNDQIVSDGASIIQPAIASMLHFYAQGRSNCQLAGSFGAGVPLSGGNLTALNFYLGPSLILGREQRIIISAGLSTGPVKRLAKGFKIGDTFDPDGGDLPSQTRYELGYFVGVSFKM